MNRVFSFCRRPAVVAVIPAMLMLAFCSIETIAQTGPKVPLNYAVYDSWKSIIGVQSSQDGKWIVYALTPEEGVGEVIVRNVTSGKELRAPRGSAPVFRPDGSYVVCSVAPGTAATDAAKAQLGTDDKTPASMGILRLSDGKFTVIPRIARFRVPEFGGGAIAYLKAPADKPKAKVAETTETPSALGSTPVVARTEPGTDLLVHALATDEVATIPDVKEFIWNRTGTRLAYQTSSAMESKNGIFVRDMATGSTITLVSGKAEYKSIAFDEPGNQVAFLTDRGSTKSAPAYSVYRWVAGDAEARPIATAQSRGLPAGYSISENGTLKFSKDGSLLFLGLAPTAKPSPKGTATTVKVDIWSWKDDNLQSTQKVTAEADRKRTFLAVVPISDPHVVALADELVPEVQVTDGAPFAVGGSTKPYRQLRSWDADYADYYLIDLKTGSREKVVTKSVHGVQMSPGGKYLTYYSIVDRGWVGYRIKDKKTTLLTRKIKVRLTDEEMDRPEPAAPYGVAGWTKDDRAVLIYDRYDIWAIEPFGGLPVNLTGGYGRQNKTVLRYSKLDPEETSVSSAQPLLLSATDEKSRATGYFRLVLKSDATATVGPIKKLFWANKSVASLIKARYANRYVFTQQTYEEFPDLWASDSDFSDVAKVSNANPQQSKYLWGRAELLNFESSTGKKLRAVLIKPENFDPNHKYPLIVNIYEKMSDRVFAYHRPAPGTSICISRYVSNGYVVLLPDIAYSTGSPGQSAMNCVLPAIQKVVDGGYIDPQRIGIQGHSWGGYEIAYMITRTNLFRAAEAGAAVANMISAYGGIRWGTGISRAGQYEHGQSRMGGTPWDLSTKYIANSPIFAVKNVTTPYLTIANDADGAVPWYQGIEFLTAMRRLGKEAYLFSYNGEDHNLVNRANQKHWTVHMDEFFDHFLLDAPLPEWMDKGVPYLERSKRNVKFLYEPVLP